jgi:hypothetical protein
MKKERRVNIKSKYIGTRQQSHRSSHAVTHQISDDVEEREQGERRRLLPRETTTSWAKQPSHETTSQPLYELLLSCNSKYSFLYAQIMELYCSTGRLTRQAIVEVVCWVDPKLCVNAWNGLSDNTNVLSLTNTWADTHVELTGYRVAPGTWEGNRSELGSWSEHSARAVVELFFR